MNECRSPFIPFSRIFFLFPLFFLPLALNLIIAQSFSFFSYFLTTFPPLVFPFSSLSSPINSACFPPFFLSLFSNLHPFLSSSLRYDIFSCSYSVFSHCFPPFAFSFPSMYLLSLYFCPFNFYSSVPSYSSFSFYLCNVAFNYTCHLFLFSLSCTQAISPLHLSPLLHLPHTPEISTWPPQ